MDWKLGPPVLVGEKVTWSGQSGSRPQGVVRWIGKLPDLTAGWSVGIELDVALERGSSNGFWEGRKLFDCRPKHGLLVPINEVQKSSTKSSYRLSNIENRLDLKLEDTQLWGPTGSNLKRISKGKNQEVLLKDRFSVLESKVSQWSLRNRGANGLDWRKKNQDRRPSKADEGGQSASLRQQHVLKPRNQDTKSSLRNKKRKRKTYSTIEFKSSRSLKFEDDVRLDKESIDSYVQFTVNQAFEGPETLGKNMNDVVAGYFKEIKEDDNVEGRFRNTVHECDRQMDGLEGSVSGNQKEKKFFSFLKWFKKPKEEPKNLKESSAASSPTSERKRDSSCESLDTLFSTQTVRSFAYIPPTLYEPSAPPSSFLEIDKSLEESFYDNAPQNPTEETESIYDRKKKRKAPEPPRLARENSLPSTLEHKKNDEDLDGVKTCHRRTVSESFKDKKAGAYCHVQGKRKAPLPPPNAPLYPNLQKVNGNNNNNQYSSLYKKKKPAPPPPEVKNGVESQSNTTPNPQKEEQKSPILNERSNDEQKHKSEENSNQINNTNFTKDVSLSPLPSRPWYKRSQRESTGSNIIKKDLLKGFEKKKNKDMEDWMLEVGFPRRSLSTDSNHNKFNIFARLDKNEEKKKEEKRKSQISILTNISELDREAAEIVKKEQAEEKKMRAENDAKYYLPGSSQNPPNFYKNGQEVEKTDQNKNLVDNSNLLDSSYDDNINKNLEKVEKVAKTPENKRRVSASGNQGDSKAPTTSNNQNGHTEKLAETIKSNNFYKKDDPLNSIDQKLKNKENRAQTNLLNIENQSNDETKTNLFSPNILAEVTNSTNSPIDKTTKPPTNLNHFKIENKEVNYLNEPWVCQKCTLENPGWRVFCEICSSVKPRFLINIDPRNQNKPTDKPTNSPKEITKTEEILPKDVVSPAKNDQKKPEDVPHPKESSPKTVAEDKSNIKGNQEDNLEELRKKRMNFFTSKLESLCDTNDSINEADKLKLKKILKEMKNSLPKNNSREESSPELDTGSAVEEEPPKTKELGNNRQDVEAKPTTSAEAKSGAIKKKQPAPQDKEKVVEAYVITKTTVLEDIIIKKGDKPSKVSAGVQTAAPKAEEPNVLRPPPRTKKNVFDVAFETANDKPPEPKPRRKLDKAPSSTGEMFTQDDLEELTNRLTQAEGVADLRANIATMAPNTEMNTVAVNRLLRRLETAINCGDQLLAAGLAKELAQMKINCSVTRHVADSPVAGTSKITIDLYVEDKVSHQGPIPLQVSPAMTLLELKKKVHLELGIPVEVQRWILGKRLATDDGKTLEANGVNSDFCSVFLYLVAPGNREESRKTNVEKDQNSKITKPTSPPTDRKGWYYNQEEDHYSFCEDSEDESRDSSPVSNKPKPTSPQTDPTRQPTTAKIAQNENNQTKQTVQSPVVSKKKRPSIFDLRTREAESELEKELKLISGYSVKQKVEQLNRTLAENSRPDRISFKPETWKCGACNYVNSPNRVNCLACNAKKTASRTKFDATEMSGVKQQDNRNDLLKKGNNKREIANNDNIHYRALVELQDADLVPNAEPFNCPICMVDYTAGEGVVLKDCLHIFCRPCLINTVQYSEDAEVKCPYLDETYSCTSVLQQREIKALVPKGIFELHLAKSVKEAEHKIGNAFHCKTPDCRGWCIYEDNVNEFRCPVCKFTNCLTCQAIHTGINCKEYQERMKDASDTDADAKKTRKMLEEMVEKGEAMACPKCQVVLMKKWGCDWLRCSMCKTEICWVTRGFRWGPGGKGDTSGGCKCGVNGIKCHPKCNYCH